MASTCIHTPARCNGGGYDGCSCAPAVEGWSASSAPSREILKRIAPLANAHYGWTTPVSSFLFDGYTVTGERKVWAGNSRVGIYNEATHTLRFRDGTEVAVPR